jgi:cysteine-rich repeat protein
VVDADETCDDGNTDPGDGCSASCQIEPQHAGTLLYLNRCSGGCSFAPGIDNSIDDRSSLVSSISSISPYLWGDASFEEVLECVRDMYAPFGVTVIHSDPGAVPHLEIVVAGYPDEIGLGAGTGNVAPFSCGFVENGVAFAFANLYGDARQSICESAAQASGSLVGLDHAYSCPDTMTYLSGCGPKGFTDADVPCGEFGARTCACGGITQNSYQSLLGLYGASSLAVPVGSWVVPTIAAGLLALGYARLRSR